MEAAAFTENVPPTGVAASVMTAASIHKFAGIVKIGAGNPTTVTAIVVEFTQPFPSVKVYVRVCVPTPAFNGMKLLFVTPFPDKIPPAGVRIKFAGVADKQYGEALFPIVTIGSGFTMMLSTALFVHPN